MTGRTLTDLKYLTSGTGAGRVIFGSDIVLAGDLGFISGVLPTDMASDQTALPEAVEDQLLKTLSNMESILATQGMSRNNVVAVKIHLREFKRFYERVNQAYAGYFDDNCLPARSVVGVDRLPRDAMVSLDFIVHRS